MGATADKDLISTLPTTNAALTGQLATKYRLITNLQAQLRNTNINTECHIMQMNYCWYHGTQVSRNHTIQNSRFPKDKHKAEATQENKIASSAALRRWLYGGTH
jgi:hypothetical protein